MEIWHIFVIQMNSKITSTTFVSKEQEGLIVKSVAANDGDYTCIKEGQGVYTVKGSGDVTNTTSNTTSISTYMGAWSDNNMSGDGCLVMHKEQSVYKGLFENNQYSEFGKLYCGTESESGSGKSEYYVGEFFNNKRSGGGKLYEVENVGMVDQELLVNEVGMVIIDNTTSSSIIMSVEGVYKAQLVYEGDWMDGEMSGHGTRILPDGSSYTGPLIRNLPNGSDGVCNYGDGSKYIGQWRNGLRNGVGTYTTAKQEEYNGKWVADQRCGKGEWKSLLTGETYTGLWQNHTPHGYGVRVYSDKNEYTGDFINGQRHGVGTMVYKNTVTTTSNTNTNIAPGAYSGDWFMDQRHGVGKWIATGMSASTNANKNNANNAANNFYNGGLANNSTTNSTTNTLKISINNTDYEISYDGEWHSDKRNGQGVARYLSGNNYTGLYEEDEPKPF